MVLKEKGKGKFFSKTINKSTWKLALLFFATFLLVLPISAAAEEELGPGKGNWKFRLGGFFPSIDTSIQVSGVDLGDDIDIEDKLGFSDNDTIWQFGGYWRFFKRHRLGFGYHQFNRDATRTLDTEIEIGDEVFPVGARAYSELNMAFYTLDYRYSFYQGEKWEISGGLGVYWVDLEFLVDAQLQVGGEVEEPERFFESTDFNGPLPYLALTFEYFITPKWLTILKAGYFQLEVGDIDGSLGNAGVQLEYQFTKTFGLGLGYDYFRIDVTVEDKPKRADLLYQYHGVQAYGILRF